MSVTIIQDALKRAIERKNLVLFYYNNLPRVVEPHVLGIQKGITQLLAFQVRGHSSSGGLPQWRRYDVTQVTQLSILDESFPGPRDNPSGKHTTWDSYIAIVE